MVFLVSIYCLDVIVFLDWVVFSWVLVNGIRRYAFIQAQKRKLGLLEDDDTATAEEQDVEGRKSSDYSTGFQKNRGMLLCNLKLLAR